MQTLHHAGVLLQAAEIGAAVHAVCGGRIPAPRRGPPPISDPVAWLDSLFAALEPGPTRDLAIRALARVLTDGAVSQLGVAAAVGRRRGLFDVATLADALERPQVWQRPATAVDLAGAIAEALAAGRGGWSPRLLRWLPARELAGTLWSPALIWDLPGMLAALPSLLAGHPQRSAAWLADALPTLPEGQRERARAAIAELMPTLPAPVREAVAVAIPDLAPPVPLDVRRLPWRSDDGAWFEIPDGNSLPPGPLALRRGWHRWLVDPEAVARFRVPEARADALRRAQLAALHAAVRTIAPPTSSSALGAARAEGVRAALAKLTRLAQGDPE
jgi:hypothetical protein